MRKLLTAAVVLALTGGAAQAITLGQEDTFRGQQGWTPGVLQLDGGPAGVGDGCLRVTSVGSGDAAVLSTRNTSSRWAGDYASQKVTAIEADLLNLGSTELDIRLLLIGGNYGDFTSAKALALPPDGQWHHVRFGLSASELAWGGFGNGDLSRGLHYVELLMFRHQSGASLGFDWNTPIVSEMAIDNIRAVPEPFSFLLCVAGVLLLVSRRPPAQGRCNR